MLETILSPLGPLSGWPFEVSDAFDKGQRNDTGLPNGIGRPGEGF